MFNLYKKIKLFFYSFIVRDLFISKILKINIFTIDLLHFTGMTEKMGGVAGGIVGTSMAAYGLPPIIGTPLGVAVGLLIGKKVDKQLYELNKTIKYIDDKNDNYVNKQKTEKYITTKLNSCINDTLKVLVKHSNQLAETSQNKDDESLMTALYLNIIQQDKTQSPTFIANVLSDDTVRKQLLQLMRKRT